MRARNAKRPKDVAGKRRLPYLSRSVFKDAEVDYLDQLSEEELKWLSEFTLEFHNAAPRPDATQAEKSESYARKRRVRVDAMTFRAYPTEVPAYPVEADPESKIIQAIDVAARPEFTDEIALQAIENYWIEREKYPSRRIQNPAKILELMYSTAEIRRVFAQLEKAGRIIYGPNQKIPRLR